MRLEDHAIDDLHQVALAEYIDDPDMTTALHRVYQMVQTLYLTLIRRAPKKEGP